MQRAKWSMMFMLCLVMLCLALSARAEEDVLQLSEMVLYPGSHIFLSWSDGTTYNLYSGWDFGCIVDRLGKPDIWQQSIDGERYLATYKELGLSFSVNKEGKILIILVENPLAKTVEGVAIGQSFEDVERTYGLGEELIKERPDNQALNNERAVIYGNLGVMFFGIRTPSNILAIIIFSKIK